MSKAKNIEPAHSPLSPREMVLRSKMPSSTTSGQKGVLYSEAVQLLFKKVGITEKEMDTLNLKAIKHNKEKARDYEEKVKKNKLDIKGILKELQLHIDVPYTPTIRDLPVGTFNLLVSDSERFINFHLEGSGSSWGDTQIDQSFPVPAYNVLFGTPVDGFYRFKFPFFVVGPYFLAADDGPCHDKFAEISITASVVILQRDSSGQVDVPMFGKTIPIFYRHETNKIVDDVVLFGQANGFDVPFLRKNTLTTFSLTLAISAKVSGSGSIADLNLSQSAGVIWLPEVDVAWIGS